MSETLKCRIFIGGSEGPSRIPFSSAIGIVGSIYGDKIEFEILNTDMMKKEPYRFNPAEFISWLLGAHIYVIVGQMHQGNDVLCWDIDVLLEEYKRLRGHIGYMGTTLFLPPGGF